MAVSPIGSSTASSVVMMVTPVPKQPSASCSSRAHGPFQQSRLQAPEFGLCETDADIHESQAGAQMRRPLTHRRECDDRPEPRADDPRSAGQGGQRLCRPMPEFLCLPPDGSNNTCSESGDPKTWPASSMPPKPTKSSLSMIVSGDFPPFKAYIEMTEAHLCRVGKTWANSGDNALSPSAWSTLPACGNCANRDSSISDNFIF